MRLFARGVRAVAGVVGRPAARLGGAAGRLARDNAMRNPGRTAVTASALMIGVALVTAVTIVAQGLEQQGRGQLEDTVQASTIVTATDGWSPIDPEIEQAVAGVGTVSSLRQDGALVFGKQEGINAVDPASIGGLFDYDWKEGGPEALSTLGRDGAIVNDGFATEHGLRVGSSLRDHVDERDRAEPDRARRSRSRPASTCSASARSRSRTRRTTPRSTSSATV